MRNGFLSAAALAILVAAVVTFQRAGQNATPPAAPAGPRFQAAVEPETLVWEAEPVHDEGFAAPESAPPLAPEAAALNTRAVQLGEAGHYAEAARLLEEALALVPGHPMLLHNLQATFFNWGAGELQSGDAEAAIGPLEESLRIGTAVEPLKALGAAYLHAGEPEAAASALEEAVDLAASNPQVLVLLAQAYIDLDRRPEALDLLFRAREAGAPSAAVDDLIARLSREVDAEWDFAVTETPHFRLSFGDEELPGSIDLVADALEDAYRAVGAKLGSYPTERTPVVLYARQDFHQLTQTSAWAEGVFDGRIKLPVRGLVADDPQLARVLRHEYAHSVIARLAGRRCAAWVNEGAAMWAEEEHDGDRYDWAQDVVARSGAVPLHALSGSFARLPAEHAQLAYAQSYLAIRHLVDRYGGGRLRQLLTELGYRRPLEEAFFDVYHRELEQFQQDVFGPIDGPAR